MRRRLVAPVRQERWGGHARRRSRHGSRAGAGRHPARRGNAPRPSHARQSDRRDSSLSRIARATATGLGLVSVSPSSTSCVCSASSASSQLALLLIVVRSGRVRLGGTKRSNSREKGSTRPGALLATRAARRGDTKRRLKPNTHAGFGTASWLGPSDPSSAARQIHVAWSIESELVDVGDAVERSDLSA